MLWAQKISQLQDSQLEQTIAKTKTTLNSTREYDNLKQGHKV